MEENNKDISSKPKDYDDYKMYYYLKEHPGVLISCISALTIIISFIFNLAIYYNSCKYFSYWGIDTEYIALIDKEQMYFWVVACGFYVLSALLAQLLYGTYEKAFTVIKILFFSRYESKITNKKWRAQKKQIKKIEGRARILNEGTLPRIIKRDLHDIKKENVAIGDKERILKKRRKSLEKDFCKSILLNVFVIAFFYWIISFIFLGILKPGISMKLVILLVTGTCIIFVSTPLFLSGFTKLRRELKDIKKGIDEDRKSLYIELMEGLNLNYSISRIFKVNIKDCFSKDSCMIFFINIILVLVCMSAVFIPQSYEKTAWLKTFKVTSQMEKSYVLLHKEGKEYYLEEAIIKGKDITIDTTKQKILSSDEMNYVVVTFDNVERITVEKPKGITIFKKE